MKITMMNKKVFGTAIFMLFGTLLLIGLHSEAYAKDAQCKESITETIKSYEEALNGNDVVKIVTLYTKDGVFMPASKPTASGQEQVKAAYTHVFEALDLNVSFHIDEIVKREDLAFVRTTSDGKIKLLNQGVTIENNSRELFVMKLIDGEWKIHRYMFNETTSK